MTAKPPDVRPIVAALLAAGHPPAEIERATVRALRDLTAGRWLRYESGAWYDLALRDTAPEAPAVAAVQLRMGE